MTDAVRLDRIADLTDADREELRALQLAVYPPREGTAWPGRQIEWAPAEYGVRLRDDDGALVSYVGICLREGESDGKPARIGGIGGVKTHPSARKRGLAARGMERAHEFFLASGVDFALLVCEARLLDYYGRLGWHEFAGELLVRQRGATVPFTFNRVMTCPVRAAAPRTGTLDLLGPPW